MNFALPAILIFVVVLPGFLFRTRLKYSEQTSLDYSPFGRVVIEAFLWAVGLHIVWLAAGYGFLGATLRTEALLGLLSSSADLQAVAVAEVTTSSVRVLVYFVSMYAFAFIVPSAIRAAISHWRLDRAGARLSTIFRFHQAPWYYLLTAADFERGEEPDYILIAAVIDVASRPFLYVGSLADFFFDPTGQLDRLVLENTVRRPLDRRLWLSRSLPPRPDSPLPSSSPCSSFSNSSSVSMTSATYRKPSRSRPRSMKDDCMPGSTFDTRPL